MKKKNKKLTLIAKVIGVISLIITIIFSFMLVKLNMIPNKYLAPLFIVIILIYLIMLFFAFNKKVKSSLKVTSIIIFVLFAVIGGFGTKYLYTTFDFLSILDKDIFQKEKFSVKVLDTSDYNKLEELNDKNLGIYKSTNSEKASDELSKKIEFTKVEYTNLENMFNDLTDGKISGVIMNGSVEKLLKDELSDMEISLKTIYEFKVSIDQVDIVKVVNVANTPFNVYIAGGDGFGSIDAIFNTDVNMVATIDPVNRKVLLTSIPRDYYVNLVLQGEKAYDKLTHAGYYGIEESVKSVEKLLNTDINYYVKVNFSTIEGIVDAIGGVDVYSDYDFYERAFRKYHYTVGYNHLNGEQALAFARERKSFAEGDIQRVKNQQKVVEAIIKKVTSSTALISNYDQILNSISDNMDTNISSKDISKLVKMQLNDMRGWSVESINLTGTGQMGPTYTFPTLSLYTMLPNEDSVNEAQTKIKDYLGK